MPTESFDLFDRFDALRLLGLRCYIQTLEQFAQLDLGSLKQLQERTRLRSGEVPETSMMEIWAKKMALTELITRRSRHQQRNPLDLEEFIEQLERMIQWIDPEDPFYANLLPSGMGELLTKRK